MAKAEAPVRNLHLKRQEPVHKQFGLTPRWTPMAQHDEQQAFLHSAHRFITLPKGRRSGGTEMSKRIMIHRAVLGSEYPDPRYFLGAPTHQQAVRIFWKDVKAFLPPEWVRRVSESDKYVELITGAEIWVTGLDKPERIEGTPWDGCAITEFANVRGRAWEENIRPALADRAGWAILESAPEGRNHFFELDRIAKAMQKKEGPRSAWGAYHWRSESVLPLYGRGAEIAEAKRDMDPMTYEQEFGASFINFEGRAYYTFDERLHCAKLEYDPRQPLIFCFDFNVEPGVACVCQEMLLPPPAGQVGTGVIGEVYIQRGSNTPKVCDELYELYKDHQGAIVCYGDPTGGARASSQTEGTDWDLIRGKLLDSFGRRVTYRVPKGSPSVRGRVNALCSRLLSVDGGVRLMVDPMKAPHMVLDLEGVSRTSDGDIDKGKHKDDGLTHLSDSLGYYVVYKFPVIGKRTAVKELNDVLGSR